MPAMALSPLLCAMGMKTTPMIHRSGMQHPPPTHTMNICELYINLATLPRLRSFTEEYSKVEGGLRKIHCDSHSICGYWHTIWAGLGLWVSCTRDKGERTHKAPVPLRN